MLKVRLKITIPRKTPVKLNTIDSNTIKGLEIELNWKTSNKTIKDIAWKRKNFYQYKLFSKYYLSEIKKADERNSWFSSCSFISPVNLKETPSLVSNPLKAISAVLTI